MLGNIYIHDLTNNPLAIIPIGQAQIRTGYIRIVLPIDISQLIDTITNISVTVKQNAYDNSLHKLILRKKDKLYESYLKLRPILKHRVKRWDTVGTVWKWIAGTPDAEDLRIINSTINSLVRENNRQILINDALSKRFQQVINITHQNINLERDRLHAHTIEVNQLITLFNLDSLQEQIETIEEAIILAKHGIPSSKLLSPHEFYSIALFLDNHEIHISSFEELLSQSTAQVILNNTHIAYMLKIPQMSIARYEYNYIDSIIKNGKRIALTHNYYIRNQSQIFASTQPCDEYENRYLCEGTQLREPSECVQRLVQGDHSDCLYEKVYTAGLIKRINGANILINDGIAQISSNCSDANQIINGSFLIQFEQCNLYINGEFYSNLEMITSGLSYHPTTGLIAWETATLDEPPAEYLQNLTLEHREKLKLIALRTNSLTWKINLFGSLGISTVTFVLIGIGVFWYFSRTQNKMKIEISTKEDTPALTTAPSTSASWTTAPSTPVPLTTVPPTPTSKKMETYITTPTTFHATTKL